MRASAFKFSQKIIGEGGVRLLSTVFVLLLARYLGAVDFGVYSTCLAYATLCIVFVDLGTNTIITREIARHPEDRVRIAQSSHFLKAALSVASWLILWGLTYVLGFSPAQRYLTVCLGITVIGQTLTEYFAALLNGIEEMGWEAALKVLSRAFAISLGFVALARHQPLHVIVTMMAIGTLASYAMCAWILHNRFGSFGMRMDVPFLRSLLTASLPLFGSVIFWIMYDSQDILLLNYFKYSQQDIGWFAAAMKVMDVVRVYPVMVMGVFFPTLSKLHVSDALGFQRKKRRLILFMAGTLLVVASGVYGFAPWIIRLLYKSDFLPAASILRLLAPALVIMGLNHVQTIVLIALNRERQLLAGALVLCVSNLVLAALLIPKWGVTGTCYSLLGSETAYFIFLRMTLRAKA